LAEKLIFIVDDEPYLIRSLSFVLKKEGYRVESASDGGEAVEKARRLSPDLIFLDLNLPGMNGYEVCKTIKNDPALSHTYLILLTAKGQEFERQKGIDAGANEYLTKPFSPREIVEHLRRLFGG
jgi:two-component system alkaline phosphatase synthesis response regulator PhoP